MYLKFLQCYEGFLHKYIKLYEMIPHLVYVIALRTTSYLILTFFHTFSPQVALKSLLPKVYN